MGHRIVTISLGLFIFVIPEVVVANGPSLSPEVSTQDSGGCKSDKFCKLVRAYMERHTDIESRLVDIESTLKKIESENQVAKQPTPLDILMRQQNDSLEGIKKTLTGSNAEKTREWIMLGSLFVALLSFTLSTISQVKYKKADTALEFFKIFHQQVQTRKSQK